LTSANAYNGQGWSVGVYSSQQGGFMRVLCIALTIAALSAAQPPSGPLSGSWTAAFEGRTFIRLDIKAVDGGFAGSISLGNFEVDPQGLVSRADAAPLTLKPISGVTMKGSTLTFVSKDGNDTDRFELRLLEGGAAELHFLLNDEDRRQLVESGVPVPKPIRLTNASGR
jgi:hypothetical protein